MGQHVTHGRIRRYATRAVMLKGQRAFDNFWPIVRNLPRRALLKALRDFMSPKLNHEQRSFWRQRPSLKTQRLGRGYRIGQPFCGERFTPPKDGSIVWYDESPPLVRKEVNAGEYRAQLRASGNSEGFNEFMGRGLGVEVTP